MSNRTLIILIIVIFVAGGILFLLSSPKSEKLGPGVAQVGGNISVTPNEEISVGLVTPFGTIGFTQPITPPPTSPLPPSTVSPSLFCPSPLVPVSYECIDPDGGSGLTTADIVEVYQICKDPTTGATTSRLISETPSICARWSIFDWGKPDAIREAYCFSQEQSALMPKQLCPGQKGMDYKCLVTQVRSKLTGAMLNVGYCAVSQ